MSTATRKNAQRQTETAPVPKPTKIHGLVKAGGYFSLAWLGATNIAMMLGQLAGLDNVYPGLATVCKTISVVALIIGISCWKIAETVRE